MSPRAPRPPKHRPVDPNDANASWRLFLAVSLPEDVRVLVTSLIGELSERDWPVRWVAAGNAHLTLHFLGDTAPERAELLRLALPEVVAGYAPFNLRTAGLGVFPNQRRPRVLWLGLHGPAHRLETLQRGMGESLRQLAFPVEADDFHPHITLGRVRNSGTATMPLRDLPEHVRRLLAQRGIDAPEAPSSRPVPIREIELVRSTLSHAGARYDTIARFPLSARRLDQG
ncbi:MAG: RNA 2',3'-cyclic phosphodiesterase [Chloroflexia bacterium]|nr:RNA 2',3'-cyclic phosphodiesterase [Chloroflexia bacterium]